jgi:hypothetical protein
MRRLYLAGALVLAALVPTVLARQAAAPATGPYKVLTKAKVGGEGGWDYIYADSVGRRLYIPRSAGRGVPATDATPAAPAPVSRITIFDLDTIAPVGEIPDTGGQGVAVCPKSGHGFSSSRQVSMFDTKTMTLMKKIDVGAAQPDGIYCDTFNSRVYVFSHGTKDATVIDANDGTVLGTVDLGGVPEQGVADGKGMLYVVMQDRIGSVTAVDVKTMKAVAHYSLVDKGSCNGLALDVKNHVLFAECGQSGVSPAPPAPPAPQPGQPPAPPPGRGGGQPGTPAQPMMVILSAVDGKILTSLPLAGGSDGAVFNPSTMEAFSTGGNGTLTIVKENSPTSFEVEQILQTMNGARTITFDSKTNHILTMAQEYAPPPPPPPPSATPPATPPAGPPAFGGRGGGRGTVIPGSFTILVVGK